MNHGRDDGGERFSFGIQYLGVRRKFREIVEKGASGWSKVEFVRRDVLASGEL